MKVIYKKIQIKFENSSGPMILNRVVPLELMEKNS